jgi:hypothetical protein
MDKTAHAEYRTSTVVDELSHCLAHFGYDDMARRFHTSQTTARSFTLFGGPWASVTTVAAISRHSVEERQQAQRHEVTKARIGVANSSAWT